jgi:uncharacterized repeat protein (TIGR03803 family)
VYKLDPSGRETVLHNFTGGSDGSDPYAGLTFDSAGNLFGATFGGGTHYCGVVFKMDASGNETVLYEFACGPDGGNPYAGVTVDSLSNVYGTTFYGGSGYGVVYKVTPAGVETVLHTFTFGTDGGLPESGVVLDAQSNLYGITNRGGAVYGAVYRLTQDGQFAVLLSFNVEDGWVPFGGVVLDPGGNLYASTTGGGKRGGGVVFKLPGAAQ